MTENPLGDRYRRERHLGRGAMGEVWLAEDVLLHRLVAVKSVTPAVHAPDEDDLERMMREARLAARLNHPNAVAVYDLIMVDGRPNVVMEYVTGETLAEEIAKAGGRLAPERVTEVGIAVADALAEAHELGIVHRDVKPANILVTKRGVPKLADFGIARIADDVGVTATGLMIGTPAYVAPEIARGEKADASSDVWALGITLWAALEGHPPAQRGSGDSPLTVLHRVLTETVAPPAHGGPLGPAVMRMLDPDPRRRPTASDAVGLLRRPPRPAAAPPTDPRRTVHIASPPQPSASAFDRPVSRSAQRRPPPPGSGALLTPTGQSQPPPPRRRGWILAAVAGVVVVAAIVAAAIVLLGGNGSGRDQAGSGSPAQTAGGSSGGTRSVSSSSPASTNSSRPTAAGQSYSAPGGLTVQAPAGWTEDDSAGIANIRDYDAPGADREAGTYFRIGIGNPDPAPTIKEEVGKTKGFLEGSKNPYHAVAIVTVHYSTFLAADAADIEYTGTNDAGVPRHVIERLWISGGATHIIQLNTPDSEYGSMRPVFDQLTSRATVSGG